LEYLLQVNIFVSISGRIYKSDSLPIIDMRIQLTFNTLKPGRMTIPVNYQYPLSAWIYHTLAGGDHEFSTFLHDSGFSLGAKAFKFFTFSQLNFPAKGFKVEGDRLHILAGQCNLIVSFLLPVAMENFIKGLFKNQRFSLGDKISQTDFMVASVEVLPEPTFNGKAIFTTISPIMVGKRIDNCRTAAYLSPEEAAFEQLIADNLIHKFTTALNYGLIAPGPELETDDPQITFKLLNKPRMRGIKIKAFTPEETKIIGYTFDFEIKAPAALLQIGYVCGFGEKNSLGMGCVELKNTR
jgi:CRISPR-associated endoribonuclease Cas6